MDNTAVNENEAAEIELDPQATYGGLAGHVWGQWMTNVQHRQLEIDDDLYACHLRRAGRYSKAREAEIRSTEGEPVYAPLASMQSISGAASVAQVVLPAGIRSWNVKPTPIPELPEESVRLIERQLQGEAGSISHTPERSGRKEELIKAQFALLTEKSKLAAKRMERKIDDQLVDSGFYQTMVDFIEDFATYPYAVMKRVTVQEKALQWKGGKPRAVEIVRDVDLRVSPFDIYPSPGMVGVNDGPIIERLRLRDYELAKHRTSGFRKEAIDRVLRSGPAGNWLFAWNDATRNSVEDNDMLNVSSDLIDVLRYWGQIRGDILIDYGVTDGIEEDQYYDTEVWVCGGEVLRVARNPHPLDHRPYYKAVWRAIPGQFKGTSPPSQIAHLEDICNAAMRALVRNMGMASGPQVVVMIDQLPKGAQEIVSLYPMQIHQMVSKPGTSQKPIDFFQPGSNAKELIGVFQHYWELAGDVTGIYRWNYGADKGMTGAAQTMHGLAMLLENSNKVVRHALENLESGVMIPRIHDQFLINMRYDPDPEIKGDIDIIALGSSSLIERAGIRGRRVELLQAIANTPESQIPGMDMLMARVRLAILTETARDLDIDSDKFPAEDEVDKILDEYNKMRQKQGSPKDPRVEAVEIAYKSRIEDQKLEMEDRQKQREHRVKIEQMRLEGLQIQQDTAGQRAFDAKKLDMAKDIAKMNQEDNQFNREMQVKQQQGTGI